MHQPYNRVFHGQAACAALESGARERDRRCAAPQLRFRHAHADGKPVDDWTINDKIFDTY
jgi:hypothetical protein